MTPNDFRKQFQHEQLPSVISFTGDEDFVAEQTITALENSVDKNFRSWDFVRANYDNQNIREILADAATLSFNANRRFVIIDNPLFFDDKRQLGKIRGNIITQLFISSRAGKYVNFQCCRTDLRPQKKKLSKI